MYEYLYISSNVSRGFVGYFSAHQQRVEKNLQNFSKSPINLRSLPETTTYRNQTHIEPVDLSSIISRGRS